jgi:hypothetical protein
MSYSRYVVSVSFISFCLNPDLHLIFRTFSAIFQYEIDPVILESSLGERLGSLGDSELMKLISVILILVLIMKLVF